VGGGEALLGAVAAVPQGAAADPVVGGQVGDAAAADPRLGD
jgi:hypothetical protein